MPELRRDPVTGEWVIIATERSRRPHDFRKDAESDSPKPERMDNCPFCVGNESLTPPEISAFREADSPPDTPGWWVRTVPNKYPALAPEGELEQRNLGIYEVMNAVGAHEVIIETPLHNQHPATMPLDQWYEAIWMYRERALTLQQDPRLKYVLLFRNHGKPAGASLEHPHSQLAALPLVPAAVQRKIEGMTRYHDQHGRCLYCDILAQEIAFGKRVVLQNEHFVAFAPFASHFPFEMCILPKHHAAHFAQEPPDVLRWFAATLQEALQRLYSLLGDPPYNYMIYTAPINLGYEPLFHWHLTLVPRLSIPAGFEMGTEIYINITAPEDAAEHLRTAPTAQLT
ncbi:MAG: galactose-1-phosphate uridylyltransferase [Fimbriimonadales bacterium]|nr:galactose-1-phosphate uridylyltransferase [Fimbriimonadales bacterium]